MLPAMANVAAATAVPKARGLDWVGALPFIVVHVLAVVGPIFTGITVADVVVCISLYWIRMFFVTGAYHRYFSHRTYKTSRWFQFLLALGAMSSSQKGVLWWAAHHRTHHKYSDTEKDVHSPIQKGLFYAQVGWLFDWTDKTDYSKVKDLAKYPELVFLNRFWYIPARAARLFDLAADGLVGALGGLHGKHRVVVARHLHHQLADPRVGQEGVPGG